LARTDFGTERWCVDDLGSGVCVFWFTVSSYDALSIDANDGEVEDILQVLCLGVVKTKNEDDEHKAVVSTTVVQ
jgi:hypothetical protein